MKLKALIGSALDWPEKAFDWFCLLFYRAVLVALFLGGAVLAWMLHPIFGVIAAALLLIFLGAQWTPQGWNREQ